MIDARAIVSPEAELASDVSVGPFSIIGPRVQLGPRTVVGPHAVINGPTRIGADNRIFQFASIGDAPQDKKYQGEPTRLEIGDRNVFRESCTINRGTTLDKGVTVIGSDNLFMAFSHVAHDCVVGDKTVFANCAALGGHVPCISSPRSVPMRFSPAAPSSPVTCRPSSWSRVTRPRRTRSTRRG